MPSDSAAARDESVAAIHVSLMRMRRYLSRPPHFCLPQLADLPAHIDVTHAWACETVRRLDADNEPATVKQVAGILMLDHSTASRLLTQLAEQGLATRERNPADHRSTIVKLTPIGERVSITAEAVRSHLMAWVFAEWEDQELAGFAALLGRFSETIGGYLSELISGGMPKVLGEALRQASAALPPTGNAPGSGSPSSPTEVPAPAL